MAVYHYEGVGDSNTYYDILSVNFDAASTPNSVYP